MPDRPSELELSLDAIDERFKAAVGMMCNDLATYGVAPVKTLADAQKLARGIYAKARQARSAALAIVADELSVKDAAK
jgi:hypothetical protein